MESSARSAPARERRSSPSAKRRRSRSPARRDSVTHERRPRDYRQRDRSRSRSPPPSKSRHDSERRSRDATSASHHKNRRHRSRSRSNSPKRRRRSNSRSASPHTGRSRKPLPSQDVSYQNRADATNSGAVTEAKPKEKPNFKPTGLLAAESNKVTVPDRGNKGRKEEKSIVLKYHEPPEARKPPSTEGWLLYVFKGKDKDPVATYELFSRSCWLMGREVLVADIPTEHPSCSKQHAVLQFRYMTKKDEWGQKKGKVALYLLDLESANGTALNGEKVEAARYIEVRNRDVITLGDSEREYVVLLPRK